MIDIGFPEKPDSSANRKLRWLPSLEREIRNRMGWVDEMISPFARVRRVAKPKPTAPLGRADTLLFRRGERKTA